MKKGEFLQAIQSRVARVAVGASAVRGRGNAGTVKAARTYLRQVQLAKFGARPAAFRIALEEETNGLLKSLPRSARHWGLARKLLNIFLRDCSYTTYLESAFRLSRAHAEFELPLDLITATQLKRASGRGTLPKWPGVKHLTPSTSAQFQEAARVIAGRKSISRLHLDAIWWSQSRDDVISRGDR